MKKILSLLLIALALTFIVNFSTTPVVEPEIIPQETVATKTAKIVLDFGNGTFEDLETEISETSTAFSMLEQLVSEKGLEMEIKQYDFGVFVQAIDGMESGTDLAWIYFVNGESGQVAADQQPVSDGDLVEWRYKVAEY